MGGDNRISIRGGNLAGANLGIGTVTQHNLALRDDDTDAVEALRRLLAGTASGVVALGRTPAERAELHHEVTAVQRELTEEAPRRDVVRMRWNAVLAVLGGALAASAEVAQVTQFLIDRFR